MEIKTTAKIVADVDASVKQKLKELCKGGETMKDALIRIIETAHKNK
ncbi:Arc/Mnt/CopG DNA-binding domain-containing protein [Bacillus phage vB_BcM_Sam46]|uniref:Arc/Mnt/CopG DNA-binding domain-containing protein n=2 Tax=Caudoviricetes TaxID=2731619 RepID=A0A6G9L722_9CAUD|nr:Arc/Mnt/CopG DNA-binding domain-containing protein [Bacillus phage vB_BcM_Sam112]QIQ61247.1 Arc/Mnt/CopG DNA-binding domain-containing protein [Bacillus phage vB_BcM_Sam46]